MSWPGSEPSFSCPLQRGRASQRSGHVVSSHFLSTTVDRITHNNLHKHLSSFNWVAPFPSCEASRSDVFLFREPKIEVILWVMTAMPKRPSVFQQHNGLWFLMSSKGKPSRPKENLGDGTTCRIWQVQNPRRVAGFPAPPDGRERVLFQNCPVGKQKQPVAAFQLGAGFKKRFHPRGNRGDG